MSTESLASTTPPVEAAELCRACGAPLAEDQRYCLECGERRFPMSSVLLGGPSAGSSSTLPSPGSAPPPGAAQHEPRGNTVTVIAGVGVLLLAMGVGVLIGRSGASEPNANPAPQVISVGTGASSGAGATGSGAASFTDDWPLGTNGYTVQLQTLAQASTPVSAVEAAKSAASAKGVTGIGALKSEDFSSLPAGNFVIYSGVYHKQAEAEKALKAVKHSFPGASVIRVSSSGAKASSKAPSSSSSSGGSGAGSSAAHPAPPSVAEELTKTGKGKSYEEKSKNLPNVVGT